MFTLICDSLFTIQERGTKEAPAGQNFHAVFGKNWSNCKLAPPYGFAAPVGNADSATGNIRLLALKRNNESCFISCRFLVYVVSKSCKKLTLDPETGKKPWYKRCSFLAAVIFGGSLESP